MTSFELPESSGIYRIVCTSPSAKKCYIGSSINLRKRLYEHFRLLRLGTHPNPKLQNAFKKHGETCFTCEVIELVLPMFLLEREQYWLDKVKPALNIAKDAQAPTLGRTPSPETIAKMSAAKRGKPGTSLGRKATPEQIERNRLAHLGQKVSDDARRKIAETSRGRKHRTETIEKMRQTKMGHEVSQETRAKIGEANRGNPGPMRGKTHSPEVRAKIGEAGRGRTASPETREKLSQAGRGRKFSPESIEKRTQSRQGFRHTPETREKLRQMNLGKGLGKKLSPEHCEKLRQANLGKPMHPQTQAILSASNEMRRKHLIVTAPDGAIHDVRGIREFCREHHLNPGHLIDVAKGRASQHKGYKAVYAD